jgi:hypothetical protein
MAANKIRKPRSYKVVDAAYNKAKRRAKKDGGTVAGLVENIIVAYGNGYDIKLVSPIPNVG